MSDISITDHALLRWMERIHGVDVEGWRALMRDEVTASLKAFDGRLIPRAAGFVMAEGRVVTVLDDGQKHKPQRQGDVCVPRFV
ncbi:MULTISPECIES: hypothetical protein [Methylorubrum]|uniref:hypothetical protein n=1 Tax=Methylorubrum TaxID=2282523 RepID=UPI0020A11A2C|nr:MULTISPECIES: hypothetical protein [Methylorubrum]MCP1550687.1 hypothetical protein [Methylorubrum zatmanii]MCP1552700.1 hypothetical protein [Methylorubrum extorquens]MCP1580990.1 hypothetical protein [Methylorubrum extorquens]